MRNKIVVGIFTTLFLILVGMAFYTFMSNALVASEYMKVQEKNANLSKIEQKKKEEISII